MPPNAQRTGDEGRKYQIMFDLGSYEGFKFQDKSFKTVADAVEHAIKLNYSIPFIIVTVINWKAIEKCPYPDCPIVKYKDCPIHGKNNP